MASAPPNVKPPTDYAPVIGQGIQAAGQLFGAYMASRGQNKATQASSQATAAALQFQREQEARRKAEYDKAMQAYEAKWNAWNATRTALLQRYGVDVGSASPTMAAPGSNVMGVTSGGSSVAPFAGASLGDIITQGAAPQSAWNEWSEYGLR